MNKNHKVSVIIPIYNAERYLEECLDSLKNQTYVNLEIIMINDGSQDHSVDICEKYVKMDNRFLLINKSNEGVSIARNEALKKATGTWCVFCDADDYYYKDGIEKLVLTAEKNDVDIALCNVDIVKKRKVSVLLNISNNAHCSMLPIKHYALWGYIIRMSIIKNNNIIFVPNLSFSEDRVFLYTLSVFCKDISVQNDSVYFYRINDFSVCSTSSGYKKAIQHINAALELRKIGDENFKDDQLIYYLKKEIKHVLEMGLLQFSLKKYTFKELYNLYLYYSTTIGKIHSFWDLFLVQYLIAKKRLLMAYLKTFIIL